MLGDTLNSANDSNEQVIANYEEIMNKVMPQDLYDAVDGNVEVVIADIDDGTLIFRIGKPTDPYYTEGRIGDAYGDNDSTTKHFDKIKSVVREARELVLKDRRGSAGEGQLSFDEWKQNNPNGTFAEWMDLQ